jgi:acetylornithine deacetylase/succinyl-diaminopimelate desuccinylase-like protein
VNGWNELLIHLAEIPRENGTAALHQTASYLVETFRAAGIEAQRVPFTAHPFETRFLGLFVFASCAFYFYLTRRKNFLAAGALSLLIPVVAVLDVEFGLPLFGGLRMERQENIVARIPARSPTQRLVFTAHYDTKTDLFDHVVRAPITALAFPLCGLMLVGALAGLVVRNSSRRSRALESSVNLVGVVALFYGPTFLLAFSAGALLSARSPGALDDGAACAVLVRVATELAQASPLEQTDVQIILFSGEELGAEGSALYVKSRFPERDSLPTYVVNLDPVGATPRLAVLGKEARLLRTYHPDPRIVAGLDRALLETTGSSLRLTSHGGLTDAVSFEAHGIPAATLISEVPPFIIPRGMHTAKDNRSRIDLSSLDLVKGLIIRFVQEADANGMKF